MPSSFTNGLIAYFPFCGNTGDSSGNNNHGNVINTVNYVADYYGRPNSASSFSGGFNNGRITTNNNMFKFKFTDSFSVAFWFLDAGSNSGRIISTENPEGNFRISTYSGGVYAIQFGDAFNFLYDTVQINQWNHIVYTFNNRVVKFYKNGVLKSTQTNNSTETLNYGTSFTIGSKASSAYDTWNGIIDEVTIWNRPISLTEVSQVYNIGSSLPIHLSKFSGKEILENIQLSWQTENEIDFSHFEVEHSINGINFKKLVSLTNSEKSYLHNKPSTLENYYRLKMVDKDGKFSYSFIIKIQIKKDLFVRVYPNPIKDFAKVLINSSKAQNATIFITDATGKIVFKQNKSLSTGLNDFTINSTLFISGIYQLSVETKTGKENFKIIKL